MTEIPECVRRTGAFHDEPDTPILIATEDWTGIETYRWASGRLADYSAREIAESAPAAPADAPMTEAEVVAAKAEGM